MIYIATFYTHVAALLSHRALTEQGIPCRMMPVPRSLSSSCGTCVRYEADQTCEALLDRDVEQIAEENGSAYRVLKRFG